MFRSTILVATALGGIIIGIVLANFVRGVTPGMAAPPEQAQTQKPTGPILTPDEASFLLFRYLTDWIYSKPMDMTSRINILTALHNARPKMSSSYKGNGIYIVEFEAGPPLPGQGIQQWKVYDRLATYDLVFYEPHNDLARSAFNYFYLR